MKKVIVLFANALSYLYCPEMKKYILTIGSYIRGFYFSRRMTKAGDNIKIYKLKSFRGIDCFSMGSSVIINEDCELQAWKQYRKQNFQPEVRIGNNVCLGFKNHITAINRIEIGDGLLTGQNVLISDNSHGFFNAKSLQLPPIERSLYSKGPVIIGKNVWIGDNVCILSGVTIGDNTVIGANSIVNKDIPANCLAAGIPASIVRQL